MTDKKERVELKTGYFQKDFKGTTIYVGNLSYKKTQFDLKKMFEKFGTVKYVKINVDPKTNKSKGFGFIQMTNKNAALKAIKALNEKVVDGRTLKVSIANDQTLDVNEKSKKPKVKVPTENEEKMKIKPSKKKRRKGLNVLFDYLKK
ncbi:MAG: RNA-binding protein [Bacteriovoracaceae bacterium]|jgi:RNA recognition motif-containing protein|nr:RNA-binding protein [Bacteriovoracaceae bacterium]